MAEVGKRAIDLSVDAREFHRVMAMAKKFDHTFYLNLRRDLRKAAEVAAADVRKEVLKPPMREEAGTSQNRRRWRTRT